MKPADYLADILSTYPSREEGQRSLSLLFAAFRKDNLPLIGEIATHMDASPLRSSMVNNLKTPTNTEEFKVLSKVYEGINPGTDRRVAAVAVASYLTTYEGIDKAIETTRGFEYFEERRGAFLEMAEIIGQLRGNPENNVEQAQIDSFLKATTILSANDQMVVAGQIQPRRLISREDLERLRASHIGK